MKCVECGKEIGNNQKFCKYCGAQVEQIRISAGNTDQRVKCEECGAILKAGTTSCIQCGTPVSAIGDKTLIKNEREKAKGEKAGKIIIAFITIMALALVAFIGYYFAEQYGMFGWNGKEDAETELEAIGDKEPINEETESVNAERDEDAEPEEFTGTANADVMNVEALVLQIEDQYDKIVNGISSGSYDAIMVSEGIIAYSEQELIKAIIVKKDGSEDGYAKNFYYDEDELFFAYYEDSDLHRFYFSEEQLVRWKYSPDTADDSRATNYDMEGTTSYFQWEQRVKDDALYLEDEWRKVFNIRKNVPRISSGNIRDVVASSYLDESGYNIVHLPEKVIDGDLATGWVEGVSGQGIGETITVYFDGTYLVSGIEIYAGYQKSDDLYHKNSRPKEVYVEFSDGSGESYTLNDVNDVQDIQFVNSIITESITLRIDSVYPGNKYEDTVITEIYPY